MYWNDPKKNLPEYGVSVLIYKSDEISKRRYKVGYLVDMLDFLGDCWFVNGIAYEVDTIDAWAEITEPIFIDEQNTESFKNRYQILDL